MLSLLYVAKSVGIICKFYDFYKKCIQIKKMLIKNWTCAHRPQKEVANVRAVCVCSKIKMCAHAAVVYAQYAFFLSVCTQALYGHAHRKNIQGLRICVWDVGLGYSVVQIAEPRV